MNQTDNDLTDVSSELMASQNNALMSRQRLAWVILLFGFACFLVVLISIPLAANVILQNARQDLNVRVQANQGTLGIEDPDGVFSALRANDQPTTIVKSTTLLTSGLDTALMQIFDSNGITLIGRAEIYGNASVQLSMAEKPRFAVSNERSQIGLSVASGRVRLVIPADSANEIPAVEVQTPHGTIFVAEPGSFSIMVDNDETQVTVQNGAVELVGTAGQLRVAAEQRGMLMVDGSVSGPLTAERNLLLNGAFTEGEGGLDQWTPLAWRVERDDQPAGQIIVSDLSGQPSLRFERVGVGAAEVKVRQIVDADVTNFASLQVVVSLRIANQSLAVCGTVGSECPLAIEFDYEDQNGQPRTWRQGLYASGEIGPGTLDVCQFCPPPLNVHERVPAGQLAFFDSGNILETLGQNGIEVRQIRSLTLIASGHSFDVEVVEIALVAKE